jgi:hypothetical protein
MLELLSTLIGHNENLRRSSSASGKSDMRITRLKDSIFDKEIEVAADSSWSKG